MNQEMKRIMEALMLIYGRDLQAATIAEIDFKVEYYALLRAYSKQRDALEKASKEIDEQWKLLQTATARIVDLQTHIENFEGEE